MSIYVRIAPSPTGMLHVGNIRAALFNYLFARRHGGRFLLRMDDTDKARSRPEYEEGIKRDLAWLGITWDAYEKQSLREARYFEVLEKLKKEGRVYPCFESQAELDLKRKTQLGRGLPPVYDRAALKLSSEDIARKIEAGHAPHWRFKLSGEDVTWDDAIQGPKKFPASSLSDPVLVREDGVPLYTFCSVIDDADMGITHIIRGEDHVTNTAVQLQLWRAVTDRPVPSFAHFPLLVSADGSKLSKRVGTLLSIASLREESRIEPMAVVSLLARLGTSESIEPCTSMEDLAATFDPSQISRTPPKFSLDEVKKLNAKILHATPYAAVKERLEAFGLSGVDETFWNAVRGNLETIEDVRAWHQVAYGPVIPVCAGCNKDFLDKAAALLPEGAWDETTWEQWTKKLREQTDRKGKELFMPLRLALTGADHGPELKVLLPLIGRERALSRLEGEPS